VDPAACLDHFTCYKTAAVPGAPRFAPISGLPLLDQFGSKTVEVKKPKLLCTPTNKNGEDPTAPSHPDHLEDYQIRAAALPPAPNLLVQDQFGTLTLAALKPTALQVPSAKSLVAFPPPPAAPGVDHFACYKIKLATRFHPVSGVVLQDQFGTRTVDVRKPRRLCAPVNKNNEAPGAETHLAHLLCYQIKQTSLPKFTAVSPLYVANQFGQETLAARSPRELCVPALKNP
jgi:hypothetical protein